MLKTILLNPGPVTLSQRVREAMLGSDLCHREPEFGELQDSLRRKLIDVYALDPAVWATVLLTGSGTAAVEAMLTSMVPANGRVLVVDNGVYGARMIEIAEAHGIDYERAAFDWTAAVDLSEIEKRLRSSTFTHLAVVHHETTTGRLNDIARIGVLAAAYGVQILLDGVSSFGAEELDFEGWRIGACAATANKCLHGVPGTAFVLVRRTMLPETPPRTVYLDLATYLAKQDNRGTPFTQSVQTYYALDEALNEFFEGGGWRKRRDLFRLRMKRIRATLRDLGVTPLLEDSERSCVLETYVLPHGRDYDTLHAALKNDGFVIYAGQGELSERVFRISAMGDISGAELERLTESLGRNLSTKRRRC